MSCWPTFYNPKPNFSLRSLSVGARRGISETLGRCLMIGWCCAASWWVLWWTRAVERCAVVDTLEFGSSFHLERRACRRASPVSWSRRRNWRIRRRWWRAKRSPAEFWKLDRRRPSFSGISSPPVCVYLVHGFPTLFWPDTALSILVDRRHPHRSWSKFKSLIQRLEAAIDEIRPITI